ncbi:MAG: ribonuclease N1 [Burkholderiales bacterium]|nr:ribonuclease N1 [Burkholderiales bacterium]
MWLALSLALSTALSLALTAAPAGAFTREGAPESEQALRGSFVAVALTRLPPQAQDTHRRIHAGGPFRYDKDGSVFGNRERLLPRRPRGFYREYTVPTPGERDRGARRIVCGGKEVRQPETCFYTRDHYASFQLIDPAR